MEGIKQCINGHHYRSDFLNCPYCNIQKDKQQSSEKVVSNNSTYFSFLKSKFLYIHIFLCLITSILFAYLCLDYINHITNHGEEFRLKDYKNVDINDLKSIAKRDNIEFKILRTIETDLSPRGTVVTQDPLPNTLVKKGRKVYLTVNSKDIPKVQVPPDIFGAPFKEVEQKLLALGFNINFLPKSFDLSRSLADTIKVAGIDVTQSVTKGEVLLIKGSTVTVIFGKGRSLNRIKVPDLLLYTQIEAEIKLNEAGLNLGEVRYKLPIIDSLYNIKSIVIDQDPSVGDYIESGEKVNIHLQQIIE